MTGGVGNVNWHGFGYFVQNRLIRVFLFRKKIMVVTGCKNHAVFVNLIFFQIVFQCRDNILKAFRIRQITHLYALCRLYKVTVCINKGRHKRMTL